MMVYILSSEGSFISIGINGAQVCHDMRVSSDFIGMFVGHKSEV